MALILNIETSTAVCSVSLGKDGELLAYKENKEGMNHATHLTVFIDTILKENNLTPNDLDAVAVSMGPGSYTGLRIGVSTAKGICYGSSLPLIAVSTLQAMTAPLLNDKSITSQLVDLEASVFCPMIDARRMEVYTAFYSYKNEELRKISAEIIDETSFVSDLAKNEIVFFGDGSLKCQASLQSQNAIFVNDITPTAIGMIELSEAKYKKEAFEDVAYFEPFYLKDFVATTPKKNIF
ncbi:tRNA (adenosine(37)-N6)-threonylcarbamoyltransferase complex dimerization subunit type 1 TsaB [Ancylomarina sp. 16SWW S1-10-2]|uniref:tRNA (adenosine(37)-N6)-threonylcarbamoyltransferase complex dimerization subunit type 1 TsaB n=1 Tax=Ancylomarina sp. 16SWW S1-10-2 TaxID=2499681 RepID=UPI0012AD695F|nr:tRNA (adenosine(37)-N6)-threonylcarbamoyltransferase complex dimerization subunit type 1 TsaB [Ancylomarina sp. 16SWW S1-10-2]MRT94457.1 tRNA (adenosine(37)-N6)-threonylcarbamoyltransferase complex dimerization subunit type 1 TsaB [Ancylomarina sp. 16SWW S1-10-2]